MAGGFGAFAATLYFSAVGAASVSPLLPSVPLFRVLTFWPICKETGLTRERRSRYSELPVGTGNVIETREHAGEFKEL